MSEERIALRLKTLEMAAGLNAPNYNPTNIMETADRLWAWAMEAPTPKSKTEKAVEKSLARLRASQGDETF